MSNENRKTTKHADSTSSPTSKTSSDEGHAKIAYAATMAEALACAIREAHAVHKDSLNPHHNYHYASAEAILAEARVVLARHGLALIPTRMEIRTNDDAKIPPTLSREFKLIFHTGESEVLTSEWPIINDRGRPYDKAVAIADTASLKYLLRDLLLLERVDPADEMDARNDQSSASTRNSHTDYKSDARAKAKAVALTPVRSVARIMELATEAEVAKLEDAYPNGLTSEICEKAIARLETIRQKESADDGPTTIEAATPTSDENRSINPTKRSA